MREACGSAWTFREAWAGHCLLEPASVGSDCLEMVVLRAEGVGFAPDVIERSVKAGSKTGADTMRGDAESGPFLAKREEQE
jgi:hypothetical protein